MSDISPWVFIIDTDSYAGNFEREMCAYSTGTVGECGVGTGHAIMFREDLGFTTEPVDPRFSELVEIEDGPFGESINCYQIDEHGCGRPASIWANNDGKYDSVAIYFHEEPTEEMIQIMKDRSAKYAKDNKIKIRGYRLLGQEIVTTERTV